ncbi:hypothetical protein GCM10009001_12640 [Virgibacillus siamensis]|uniref:Uncharacterized protein n=1 Tax=Virgibacillus siamensis TaxID=480071 RepID=A0ABN1FUC9_9BACI
MELAVCWSGTDKIEAAVFFTEAVDKTAEPADKMTEAADKTAEPPDKMTESVDNPADSVTR